MLETRIVQWGNSRGVRIPRPLLEQAGITEDVTMEVRDGGIVIRARNAHPREGWAASVSAMVEAGHATLEWPDDLEDAFDEDIQW